MNKENDEQELEPMDDYQNCDDAPLSSRWNDYNRTSLEILEHLQSVDYHGNKAKAPMECTQIGISKAIDVCKKTASRHLKKMVS